jgi:hypothetical protein
MKDEKHSDEVELSPLFVAIDELVAAKSAGDRVRFEAAEAAVLALMDNPPPQPDPIIVPSSESQVVLRFLATALESAQFFK